ncbi:aspartyl-tRNA(Asn)/glutamyl-tRNA(Gln) amidotransferase subunit A [Rhizobiales bacterium GAS191]|nr:aspartyl-tRNA(Asn)/glutamyl-tRNA(Gln) amidotransferase subunit A [Rhizobiales bacterium GAS191]
MQASCPAVQMAVSSRSAPKAPSRELRFLGAAQLRQLLVRRQLSVVEYVTELLDAITVENHVLNAFIDLHHDEALLAARRADQAFSRGLAAGPLHGLPFAIKDMIDVKGRRTTAQSDLFRDNIATHDATVTRRLRDAGAILIGKLTLEEFGIGSPLDPLPWPAARNPWKIEHTPGGSSSGCGVALAAGHVPLAIGTDTGGSVRNPAAMCGVVGLKPTYDLVSRQGVFPLAPSLDHVGLMARTAEDCALLLDVLADKPCSTMPTIANACSGKPLAGLRVGVLAHFYTREPGADDETLAAIATASRQLACLGADLSDVTASDLQAYHRCGATILHVEAHAVTADFWRARTNATEPVAATSCSRGRLTRPRNMPRRSAVVVPSRPRSSACWKARTSF